MQHVSTSVHKGKSTIKANSLPLLMLSKVVSNKLECCWLGCYAVDKEMDMRRIVILRKINSCSITNALRGRAQMQTPLMHEISTKKDH
jgi:hypothetical protein